MSKARPLQPADAGSPDTPTAGVPESLPLQAGEAAAGDSSTLLPQHVQKWKWKREEGSETHKKALQIFELRELGLEDKDIAEKTGLKVRSVWNIMSIARKNGWVPKTTFSGSKERITEEVVPVALDSLGQLLKHRNPKIRLEATMETLKGTAFKEFDNDKVQPLTAPVVAIKIEMPPGERQVIREGTVGGTPAFIDGEEL